MAKSWLEHFVHSNQQLWDSTKIRSKMPKILTYDPPWLSSPAPGFDLFATSKPKPSDEVQYPQLSTSFPEQNQQQQVSSAAKVILARRGTEVFVVVDKKIRWSDLHNLKDHWEKGRHNVQEEKKISRPNGGASGHLVTAPSRKQLYRVGLKTNLD